MVRSAVFFLWGCLFSALAVAQTQSVKLAWVPIADAVSYQVEIAASKHPERVLITRNSTLPQIAFELPPGLYVYKVRVVAGDGKTGPWSEVQSFKVKPGPIELLSPANEALAARDAGLQFTWKGDAGVTYHFQLVDPKGASKSAQVKDMSFHWRGGPAGTYKWRVRYADLDDTWTTYRTFQISPKTGEQIERKRPKWTYNIWAGAEYTTYTGDYADTFNHVAATTISDVYQGTVEWKSPDLPDYRVQGGLDLRHQSLVKETVILPGLFVRASRLWPLRGRVGPFLELGERKTGMFWADAYKKYGFDSVWRTEYKLGAIGEFKLGQSVMFFPFLDFGVQTGGQTSLGNGSLAQSSLFELGAAASLLPYSRWKLRLRYEQETLDWTGQVGDNKLRVTNIILDAGVAL